MSAMTLWNPLPEVMTLRDAMNQLLAESIVQPGFTLRSGAAASFPVNLYRVGDTLKVEALLPGLGPEDVDVDLHQDVMTIAARRQGWEPREGERVYVREIVGGEFARSFTLPVPVDAERATADFAGGILTLTLPVAEAAKPKKIQITRGGERS